MTRIHNSGTMLLLLFSLSLLVLKTSGLPCNGVQNKYVCHPTSPSQFQICIGGRKYVMKCPGGLQFNTRTQTCDWPKNADCGKRTSGLGGPRGSRARPQTPRRTAAKVNQHDRADQRFPQAPRVQHKAQNPYTRAKYLRMTAGYGSTGYTQPSPRKINRGPSRTRSRSLTQGSTNTRSRSTAQGPTRSRSTDQNNRWRTSSSQRPTNRRTTHRHPNDKRSFSLVFDHMKNAPPNSVAANDRRNVREDSDDFLKDKKYKQSARKSTKEREDDRFSLRTYPWWAGKSSSKTAKVTSKQKSYEKPPTPTPTPTPTKPHKKQAKKQRKKKPVRKGKCDPSTCQLPDCHCVGTAIPKGLPANKVPMMVMLTFDDSVNVANFDYYVKLFDGKFRNPNKCPIKGTFYVSGDATEYHFVTKLHKGGNEIASHSMSHRTPTTWWATAGYQGFYNEIEGMKHQLSRKSNIPLEDIQGMRVPFLQVGGDDQYQFLEDYEYEYDSSMVAGPLYRSDEAPIWPFTLDYPPDYKSCNLAPCPKKSYPGLWELPLIRWYGVNRIACAMPDACVTGPGRRGTYKFLKDNFNRHYKTNKAPFGIYIHASWFRRKQGNFEGLMDLMQEFSGMDDVWVITQRQVIDWMKNPVPMDQAANIPSWGC